MQVVYERCCGIDVHKKVIVATLRIGRKADTRQFGAYTENLREMAAWLKASRCQMIAMESTGPYWKPLYNIFEMEGLETIVVNAQHMKAVPGRKTDVKDAKWIADLLQHGLLKASFIPDREQRELRELTRYRKCRIEERAREINRLQKVLEGANIKLKNAVTNIMGVSAQRMLRLILSDEELTLEAVAARRDPMMKASVEELFSSLLGIMTPLQKELLAEILRVIREQTAQIKRIDQLIDKHMNAEYIKAAKALDVLPGIGIVSAHQIVAEIGIDMSRFPSAKHLCSWAGVCPGNNESAGKIKSARINKANKTLRSTLVECAHAATRVKGSYFSAQYQRLAVRRGKNKATVAVAHSMLIAIYHVLNGHEFRDLGSSYYSQFNRERKINSHLKQLKDLGWEPPAQSAVS
ncbi:IS110 family transposase [Desulfosporosinus sp.]|uniref:IS110 family transposase n=1 Tax=Desulfosporosinus sp. TaxID=157907 RepID=UPI0025C13A10|nr:IS110 family transposase [Desulfosporosinus sp.]MBC2724167.1 IS110 family transposase [Desulfosporosinus sp.]MBC2726073.1 IS110 family transposase [Desulfosporosinus sp.]